MKPKNKYKYVLTTKKVALNILYEEETNEKNWTTA